MNREGSKAINGFVLLTLLTSACGGVANAPNPQDACNVPPDGINQMHEECDTTISLLGDAVGAWSNFEIAYTDGTTDTGSLRNVCLVQADGQAICAPDGQTAVESLSASPILASEADENGQRRPGIVWALGQGDLIIGGENSGIMNIFFRVDTMSQSVTTYGLFVDDATLDTDVIVFEAAVVKDGVLYDTNTFFDVDRQNSLITVRQTGQPSAILVEPTTGQAQQEPTQTPNSLIGKIVGAASGAHPASAAELEETPTPTHDVVATQVIQETQQTADAHATEQVSQQETQEAASAEATQSVLETTVVQTATAEAQPAFTAGLPDSVEAAQIIPAGFEGWRESYPTLRASIIESLRNSDYTPSAFQVYHGVSDNISMPCVRTEIAIERHSIVGLYVWQTESSSPMPVWAYVYPTTSTPEGYDVLLFGIDEEYLIQFGEGRLDNTAPYRLNQLLTEETSSTAELQICDYIESANTNPRPPLLVELLTELNGGPYLNGPFSDAAMSLFSPLNTDEDILVFLNRLREVNQNSPLPLFILGVW